MGNAGKQGNLHSLKNVCWLPPAETEMVEWISALEGSIAKIVKQLAGVDDSSSDGHTKSSSSREKHRSSSSRNRDTGSDWAKQVGARVVVGVFWQCKVHRQAIHAGIGQADGHGNNPCVHHGPVC